MECALDKKRICDENCRWFNEHRAVTDTSPEVCMLIDSLSLIRGKLTDLEFAINDLGVSLS